MGTTRENINWGHSERNEDGRKEIQKQWKGELRSRKGEVRCVNHRFAAVFGASARYGHYCSPNEENKHSLWSCPHQVSQLLLRSQTREGGVLPREQLARASCNPHASAFARPGSIGIPTTASWQVVYLFFLKKSKNFCLFFKELLAWQKIEKRNENSRSVSFIFACK